MRATPALAASRARDRLRLGRMNEQVGGAVREKPSADFTLKTNKLLPKSGGLCYATWLAFAGVLRSQGFCNVNSLKM